MRKREPGSRLQAGGELDFWRVVTLTPGRELRLIAETILPGEGSPLFRLRETEAGTTELTQQAQFLPRGLGGMIYWGLVAPFHKLIFPA